MSGPGMTSGKRAKQALSELIFGKEVGLPLILWTPSRHNSHAEVPDGQSTTEVHTRV